MTRRRKAGRGCRTPPLGRAGGIADVTSAQAARPEPSGAAGSPPTARPRPGRAAHPVLDLLGQRAPVAVFTLFVVSVLVFLATEVLPGNAANAVLGRTAAASPAALHRLEAALHLNRGVAGVALGAFAALRKDGWFDHITSVTALAVTALPEFVVAIGLVILFSTVVTHLLPGVSLLPPGTYAWNAPQLLILPVATLVIVIVPYIQRMARAAMIEALESDYVEMARLKGVPMWRIVLVHALPNAT